MTVARRERAALIATMRQASPDAPTLCEGWQARDLAAHLYVREHRLDASPGIAVPAFASYTEKVQNHAAQSIGYEELLDKIAAGPPLYSPFKLLDPVANVGEMFIHHEDMRRAQPDWAPRVLDADLEKSLARTLSLMARLTLSKVPARVTLQTPDGHAVLTAGKGGAVVVTGNPSELLLFATGRTAQVEYDGDAATIAALKDAPKGL